MFLTSWALWPLARARGWETTALRAPASLVKIQTRIFFHISLAARAADRYNELEEKSVRDR